MNAEGLFLNLFQANEVKGTIDDPSVNEKDPINQQEYEIREVMTSM